VNQVFLVGIQYIQHPPTYTLDWVFDNGTYPDSDLGSLDGLNISIIIGYSIGPIMIILCT